MRSHSDILDNFMANYYNYLYKQRSIIDGYIEKDKNIGDIIELACNYNTYEKDTKEWYMSVGIGRILSEIDIYMRDEDNFFDETGYSCNNMIEYVRYFIETYLYNEEHTSNIYGVNIEFFDAAHGYIGMHVDWKKFDTIDEMNKNGYCNKAEDIMNLLNEFAYKNINSRMKYVKLNGKN